VHSWGFLLASLRRPPANIVVRGLGAALYNIYTVAPSAVRQTITCPDWFRYCCRRLSRLTVGGCTCPSATIRCWDFCFSLPLVCDPSRNPTRPRLLPGQLRGTQCTRVSPLIPRRFRTSFGLRGGHHDSRTARRRGPHLRVMRPASATGSVPGPAWTLGRVRSRTPAVITGASFSGEITTTTALASTSRTGVAGDIV